MGPGPMAFSLPDRIESITLCGRRCLVPACVCTRCPSAVCAHLFNIPRRICSKCVEREASYGREPWQDT